MLLENKNVVSSMGLAGRSQRRAFAREVATGWRTSPTTKDRHSLATIMAADGAHVAVIAGMLGHANPTTTLSTYTHFVPGMQSMAVKRLNEMFPASLVRDLEGLPEVT